MGFEVFEKGSAPASTIPTVTIQKRGLFSLNDAAYRMLGEPEAVKFLWDAEERLVALKPTTADDLNGYPARRQSHTKGRSPVLIAGTMFTRYIELDTTHAKRWTPAMRDDFLIVDLKQDGALVISNRNRSKAAAAQARDED